MQRGMNGCEQEVQGHETERADVIYPGERLRSGTEQVAPDNGCEAQQDERRDAQEKRAPVALLARARIWPQECRAGSTT